MAAQKRSASGASAERSGGGGSSRSGSSAGSASGPVGSASGPVVTLPVLHSRVPLPAPEHVAYYGAIGVLAALEVIEWPVAAIIAGGHLLASHSRNQVAEGVGQGAEDA